MTGILLSPDETSALFSDPDDGSLTFWRMPSQEGGGGGDGGGTSEVATLIPSNPRSVGKVYSIRVDVVSEKLRQAKMEVDGEEQKPGVVRKAMGWLPFGRDGFIRKNQREHAEANWGETYVTLTDRGRLVSNSSPPAFSLAVEHGIQQAGGAAPKDRESNEYCCESTCARPGPAGSSRRRKHAIFSQKLTPFHLSVSLSSPCRHLLTTPPQEGFMDGRRVFREGGPSFFNLGRKRTDYEVRATAEGLEETKAGAPCWKIKLKT